MRPTAAIAIRSRTARTADRGSRFPRHPLRPRRDDDGAVRHVSGVPARIRGRQRSAVPRATQRVSGVRPASGVARVRRCANRRRGPVGGSRRSAALRADCRRQGYRRVSSGVRRDVGGCGPDASRTKAPRGEAARGHGRGSWRGRHARCRGRRGAAAADVGGAADRGDAQTPGPRTRRIGRSAQSHHRAVPAVFAAASPAPRRSGPSARHDLRQSVRRANRANQRRGDPSPRQHRRPLSAARPRHRDARRRFGRHHHRRPPDDAAALAPDAAASDRARAQCVAVLCVRRHC